MRIASLSLIALLGVGSFVCTLKEAIAPSIARAYTSRVNITLDRQPNESFATLVRRAEAVARAAAQRSFDNDILVTEAAIIITGQNIGLSAPILTLEVNRQNWIGHPDAQRWSKYYPNSKQLLRIDDPVPATVATAPSPPAGQRPEPTLGTGVIQTTLRWSTTDDLDLEVIDTRNQRVFFGNKKVASGGELDVDSNAGCQDTITNPVENIFWPQTGAPPGNYVVRVNLYQRCATRSGPIAYKLRLLVQGRTQEINGTVDSSNQIASYPFTLTAGNPPPPGTPIVPTAGTSGGNQPSNPTTTPGQRPANPTGGNTPRTNPANNSGRSSTNRTGSTGQRANPGSNSGSNTNRTGSNSQRTNSGTNSGRSSTTNRTGSTRQRANTGNNSGSTTNPASRTGRTSNTGTTRPTNTPASVQNTPATTQPATNNRPAPTYGPGVIRRARELRQRLQTNPPGSNLPEN